MLKKKPLSCLHSLENLIVPYEEKHILHSFHIVKTMPTPIRPLCFYKHRSETLPTETLHKITGGEKKTTIYRFNTKYQDIYIKITLITQQ